MELQQVSLFARTRKMGVVEGHGERAILRERAPQGPWVQQLSRPRTTAYNKKSILAINAGFTGTTHSLRQMPPAAPVRSAAHWVLWGHRPLH